MPDRILVTGASGFVGGAVARAVVAAGHEVVTSSRRDAQVPGARHVRWDLDADEPPRRARERVGDVDVVVHAAAFVGEGGRAAAVHRTSVGGTRAVRRAFPAARFVHVSSASVYDPFRPSVRVREEQAPVERYLNVYAKAKAEAVVLAEASSNRSGGVVVLRPRGVGTGGHHTPAPGARCDPRPRPAASRRGSVPPVAHVRGDAHGCRASGLPPGPAVAHEGCRAHDDVNVADAEPVVLAAALRDLLECRGLGHVRVLDVPWRLARHLGTWPSWASGRQRRCTGRRGRRA